MMQHRFDDVVSVKGMVKLERLAADEAERLRCIAMAGRRIAADMPESAAWIALQVMTGREKAVENAMAEADIETCVPTCKGPERRRNHKKILPSDMPVFTGYVFVRCVPSDPALHGILSFEHVVRIVGVGERPLRIADETISRFRNMAVRGAYDWEVAGPSFVKGERVRVVDGPFVGMTGVVVAFGGPGKGHPVIEIDMWGRKVPSIVPLAMLETLCA